MSEPVYIDVLPIPDRIDEGKCRIAIQLTPTLDPRPSGQVDVANWPVEIAGRASQIRLHVASYENDRIKNRQVFSVATDLAEIFGNSQSSIVSSANNKWKESFPDETGWGDILGSINVDESESAREALLVRGSDAVGGHAGALLDEFIAEFYQRAQAHDIDNERNFHHKLHLAQEQGSGVYPRIGRRGHPWLRLSELLHLEERCPEYLREKRDRYEAGALEIQPWLASEDFDAQSVRMNSVIEDSRKQRNALDQYLTSALQSLESNSSSNELVEKLARSQSNREFNQAFGALAQSLLDSDEPDPLKPAPDDEDEDLPEYGQRKLSTILSYPTLAKYFGLCVDIVVEPHLLEDLRNPVLAVELLDSDGTTANPKSLAWTAYEIKTVDGNLFFGPRSDPRPELRAAFTNGMIDLNEKLDNGNPAYVLATGGTPHTVARLDEKARLMTSRIQTGRTDEDDPEPLPGLSTRGVVLYNKIKRTQELVQLAREGSRTQSKFNVNHAEDLIQGMRVDVHLDKVGDSGYPSGNSRWRPLTERIIQFGRNDVHPNFLGHPKVQALSYRDNAIVMAPVEEKKNGDFSEEWIWEEEFIWGGGSLAAPSPQSKVWLTKQDLPISIIFSLPESDDAAKHCAPPLRLGRSYRLRARMAMPLGCGLTYDDAERKGWRDDHAFPAFDSADSFIYRRFEEVGAPPILLPWDSPLVRERDESGLEAQPSVEEMVAGVDWLRKHDRRIAIPARLSIDEAAQQAQHDKRWRGAQKVPSGAFQEGLQLVLCGPDGQLPEARNGKIVWQEKVALKEFNPTLAQEVNSSESGKSRGPVYYPHTYLANRLRREYTVDGQDIPQPRYYPDAWSREMVARLVPIEGFTASCGSEEFEFWSSRGGPRDALPIQVELRADEDIQGADFVKGSTVRLPLPEGGYVSLRNIAVRLGKGEMIDLEIYAKSTNEGLELGHASYPREILTNLSSGELEIPIVQLVHRRRLRLVHPVQKPTAEPTIKSLQSTPITVDAEFGTLVGSRVASPTRNLTSVVAKLATDPAEEGGAVVLFSGEIELNGRTTSKLRLDAYWKGYGLDTVRFDAESNAWMEEPSNEFATLFDLDPGPDEDSCDLALDPTSYPRGLSYSFSNGRARRLTVKPVASSRFAAYYPPEPDQEIGLNQLASTERAGPEDEHWIQCTFRPKAPIVDRFLPVFFDAQNRFRGRRTRFTRHSAIRIFLKDWYDSGEGEKLAVVFDQVPDRLACEYLDEDSAISRFSRLLTRWGRDPTRNTESSYPHTLRPENILGKVIVRNLKLYTGSKSDPADQDSNDDLTMLVDAAIIEPKLDRELGLYCDLEFGEAGLDPAENRDEDEPEIQPFIKGYMPFVTLGLARYQEHALPNAKDPEGDTSVDLRLSHAESKTTQILPYRFGEVRRVGSRTIEVEVGGQTFEPIGDYNDTELEIRLLVVKSGAPYPNFGRKYVWYPVTVSGREVIHKANKIPFDHRETRKDGIIWTCNFELPLRAGSPNFAVQIDEYECLPIVEDPFSPSAEPKIARRGPLFSKFVEIN